MATKLLVIARPFAIGRAFASLAEFEKLAKRSMRFEMRAVSWMRRMAAARLLQRHRLRESERPQLLREVSLRLLAFARTRMSNNNSTVVTAKRSRKSSALGGSRMASSRRAPARSTQNAGEPRILSSALARENGTRGVRFRTNKGHALLA